MMLKGIYMLNKLPQSQTMIMPDSASPVRAVEYINSYIDKNCCKSLSVDISSMNVIDACYVSTLCSTKHFAKYPNGKITWKVSSQSVREFNHDLELGNSFYII